MAAAEDSRHVYSIAFFGFGNAGRAAAKLLLEKEEFLNASGVSFEISAIFTGRHGSAWLKGAAGLDLVAALARDDLTLLEGDVDTQASVSLQEQLEVLTDLKRRNRLHVVFDAAPANYETAEPALSITKHALGLGVHVVSANKAPVALALDSLEELAAKTRTRYMFESACMDGVPVFNLVRRCLPAAKIVGFEGILNSTTNVIISTMEEDPSVTFDDGLLRAQEAGIAETDPSGDIDGYDAAVKCVCLGRALLGIDVKLQQVQPLQGIRGVSQSEIAKARDGKARLMLVCEGQAQGASGSASLSVRLREVTASSPMFNIRNASACVTLFTDVLGPITITSTDPTLRDTGYGYIADFLEIVRKETK